MTELPSVTCADLAERDIHLSAEESKRFREMVASGEMRPTFKLGEHGIVIEE